MSEEPFLIDSPVTPYSDIEAIEAWIRELRAMPDNPQVRAALAEAEQTLRIRQDAERSDEDA